MIAQKNKEIELKAEVEKRRIELEKQKKEAERIRQKNLITAIKTI